MNITTETVMEVRNNADHLIMRAYLNEAGLHLYRPNRKNDKPDITIAIETLIIMMQNPDWFTAAWEHFCKGDKPTKVPTSHEIVQVRG